MANHSLPASDVKSQMLAAIQGQSIDQIPWVPRLDLWYRSHRFMGTLPPKYKKATLMEITDDLGMGFHAVIPDFRDLRNPGEDIDRALGIYNLWSMPYHVILENVDRHVHVEDDRTVVEYRTPVGTIQTTVLYNESMRQAGISITHIAQHAFQSPQDYRPLGYLFENARVVPNYAGYREWADRIGDRGLAVAFVSLAASPMHLIQRELMPLDVFFYEINDRPDEIHELAEKIAGFWNRILTTVIDCPAEVFLLGANYDASVTYPPFFGQHIQPWLQKFGHMLHAQGKFLLTHTDGENSGLLNHYLKSGFDIADSICPTPMTKLSFKDVRDAFDGRITIMGGIPSVSLLPSAMPDREFDIFLDQFFTQIGRGDHLILGISDTTPPGADFSRLQRIGEYIRTFGPVRT